MRGVLLVISLAVGLSGATAELGPGVTFLTEPLRLTAADSGRRFVGAADGSTVLSGGVRVDGWREKSPGVWAARLPVAGGRPLAFESLFVNGRRADRSRHPEKGFFHLEKGGAQPVLREAEGRLFAEVPESDLGHVSFVAHDRWATARRPVAAYDAATRRLTLAGGSPQGGLMRLSPDEQYFAENLRSAFVRPGQWFLDVAAGEVLYRPRNGESLADLEAIAPRPGLETLVTVDGASDIRFENVTFAHTAPSAAANVPSSFDFSQGARTSPTAVVVDRATNVVFRGCTFAHMGGYAAWLRTAAVSNAFVGCRFEDLGGGGVKVGEHDFRTVAGVDESRPLPPAPTHGNRIENCVFRDGGRFHEAACGILVGHASDNAVVGNLFEDFSYTAISVGFVWGYCGSVAQRNLIANNEIRRIGNGVLSDLAGIYTLAASFGTRISGNVIRNVSGYAYGGWGLYFDEGSEGIVAEGNDVANCTDGCFHQHFGRNNVLRGNRFFNPDGQLLVVTRAEPHRSLTVEGNTFRWNRGDAFACRYCGMLGGAKIDWRDNEWICADGAGTFWGRTYEEWKDAGFAFDDTAKIQTRLDAAAAKGGGEVVIEPGDYAITSLRIGSGVTLRLRNGAHLFGNKDPRTLQGVVKGGLPEAKGGYPRWFCAMIRVFGAHDVAIVGEGGDAWIDGQDSVDPEGEEGYRGVHGIHVQFSTNIVLRGYTMQNCGNYAHLIDDSANVTMDGVRTRGGHDGVDFHFTDRIRVTGCDFRAGDDCVAGFGNRDVVVSNCLMSTACSPVRFGGTDVLFTDCRARGPSDYAHRWTLTDFEKRVGVPSPSARGRRNTGCFYQFCTTAKRSLPSPPGRIVFRNFMVENAGRFICTLTGQARIWSSGPSAPELVFENVKAAGLERPGAVCPADDSPVVMKLRNCTFAFKDPVDAAFVGANVTFDAKDVKLVNAKRLADVFADKAKVIVPEHPSWRLETPVSLRRLMR